MSMIELEVIKVCCDLEESIIWLFCLVDIDDLILVVEDVIEIIDVFEKLI